MMNVDNWPSPDKAKLFEYLSGNSYRSERFRLLYVSTPKVACTTLKWWFADLEGYAHTLRQVTDSVETDPDLVIHDNFYKAAPNVTGLTQEALTETISSEAYFRFAVVRNPFKRIFSAWQSKLLLREPYQVAPYLQCSFFNQPIKNIGDMATAFEGFLEHLLANEVPNFWDMHWTPQVTLLRPDLINYTKLVQLEHAEELSDALAEWMGANFVDPFAIRSANESLIPYLPELITARSAELIRLLYAEDFAKFGYSTQPPTAKESFSTDQFNLAIKAIEILRGRHQRLGEMSREVVKHNQVVAQLDRIIAERDRIIAERDRIIAERDIIINAIYASHSWRLTRPLRSVAQRLKNFKHAWLNRV